MLNKEKSRLFAGKKSQVVLFAILLITIANCQNWKILTNNDNKFKFDNVYSVQNDTLFVIESGTMLKVPIKDISNIWYNNFSVGRGIIGSGFGGLLGGVVGYGEESAIFKHYEGGFNSGYIIGAIAGGVIFSRPIGKHYVLSDMTIEQKIAKINYLTEKYNNWMD